MKIEFFERNSAEQVVAVSGTDRIILPWDAIAQYKPTGGDIVEQDGDDIFIAKPSEFEEVVEVEAVIEKVTKRK